jgi:hypothetical protein
MDSQDIPVALLNGGREFLAALRRLRLEPEGLLWAHTGQSRDINDALADKNEQSELPGEWRLLLITAAVDEGGPLAMNDLLFKAYNKSATPLAISPFVVDVFSARSPFVERLMFALEGDLEPVGMVLSNAGNHRVAASRRRCGPVDGLWFDRKWVYQLAAPDRPNADGKAAWRNFAQSVNTLAA